MEHYDCLRIRSNVLGLPALIGDFDVQISPKREITRLFRLSPFLNTVKLAQPYRAKNDFSLLLFVAVFFLVQI